MENHNPLLWTMALTAMATTNVMAQTDVTSKIANPEFSDGVANWTSAGFDVEHGVVEHYAGWNSLEKTDFQISQKVTLPAGVYRLVGHAFYRQGANFDTDPEVSQAYMFAGSNSVKVRTLASEAVVSYANVRKEAADAFGGDLYRNNLIFVLDKEQEIELGFKGKHNEAKGWFIAGSVKLEFIGYDANAAITNPGFESELTGWVNNGFKTQSNSSFEGKQGNIYCEQWCESTSVLSNIDIHQDLTLPNGTYILRARGQLVNQKTNTLVEGLSLYAGNQTVKMLNGLQESVIENIEVTDGKLVIGAKVEDAKGNWAHFDWVTLTLSDASMNEVKDAFRQKLAVIINKANGVEDDIISEVMLKTSEMQVKLNNMTYADYKDYKNEADNNLLAQIDELDKNVSNAVANKKQYDAANEAYATLTDAKTALEDAYVASDKSMKDTYDAAIAAYDQFKADLEAAYAAENAGTLFDNETIETRISNLAKSFEDVANAITSGNENLAAYATVNTAVHEALNVYSEVSKTLYAELSGEEWHPVYGDWYAEAIVELNKIKREITAVQAGNDEGKTSTEEGKSSLDLKADNLAALEKAKTAMNDLSAEYVAKATAQKGYYSAACEDIKGLTETFTALFDNDLAPQNAFDTKEIEDAIDALQANVDAANVAHTIKGEIPFCDNYAEDKAAIEKKIAEFKVAVDEYKANNATFKTIAEVQTKFNVAKDGDSQANPVVVGVNELVSKDSKYVVDGKYAVTESKIQTAIDALTADAEKAYKEGKAGEFNATLSTDAIVANIEDYFNKANEAFGKYEEVSAQIAVFEVNVDTLDSIVVNREITVGGEIDATETYGMCIDEAKKELEKINNDLAAVLATEDTEHYNKLMAFSMTTTYNDRIVGLQESYAVDFEKWNAKQQEVAAERMIEESEKRIAIYTDTLATDTYVYTEETHGLKASELNSIKDDIEERLEKAINNVKAAKVAEAAEAITILSETVVNLNAIEGDLAKLYIKAGSVAAEFKAEVAAYDEKVKAIAELKALLNGKEKTETEAAIASVADLNKDTSKDFSTQIAELNGLINAIEGEIEASRGEEKLREDNADKQEKDTEGNPVIIDGYNTRIESIRSDINKLRDAAVASTDNLKAKEELEASITAKDKNVEAAIEQAKKDVANDEVCTGEARVYYQGVIAECETKLGKIREDITTAYNEGKAVAEKENLANRISNLYSEVVGIKAAAEANESAYKSLVEACEKANSTWDLVYERVTSETEIPAEVLNVYMEKLNAQKATLDSVKESILNSWSNGTAVADEAAQSDIITSVSNELAKLNGSWTEDYNEEVAEYNASTKAAFDKAHNALKETYSNAVKLITDISKTKYAAEFTEQLNSVTGPDGIYSYATKIRTLKVEADAEYASTTVGDVFDEDKSFEAKANEYKSEIETLLADYTDAVNKYAIEVYDAAYLTAESLYNNAKSEVKDFDKTIYDNAFSELATILQNAEDAKTKVDFATKLDGILLSFSLFESKIVEEKEILAKNQYETVIADVNSLIETEAKAIAEFHNAEGKTGTYSEAYNALVADNVTKAKEAYVLIEDGKFFESVTTSVKSLLDGYISTISELQVGVDKDGKPIVESHTHIYIDAYNADKAYHANDVAYEAICDSIANVQDELDALKEYVETLLIAHNEAVNERIEDFQASISAESLKALNSHETGTSVNEKDIIESMLGTISSAIEEYYKEAILAERVAVEGAIADLRHDYDLAAATDLDNESIDGYKDIIEVYANVCDSLYSDYNDGDTKLNAEGKPELDENGNEITIYATAEQTHDAYVALETNIGKTRSELAAIYDATLVDSTIESLNAALAELEADYNDIVAQLEDCHEPVSDKYATAVEAMKDAIDAEKAHIANDAEVILIYAENHAKDIEAIASKYAGLSDNISKDEIPYDVNDAAYERLISEIETLQGALDEVYSVSADYEYKESYTYTDEESEPVTTTRREFEYARISKLVADDKAIVEEAFNNVALSKNSELINDDQVKEETSKLEKNLAYYNAKESISAEEYRLVEAYNEFNESLYSESDRNELETTYNSIKSAQVAVGEYNEHSYNEAYVNNDINGDKIVTEEDGNEVIGKAVVYKEVYAEVMTKLSEIAEITAQFAADVTSKKFEIGDIDRSGSVDVVDWNYVRNIVLGVIEVEKDSPEFFAANVNGDDDVNIGDVTMIANKIMTGDFYNYNYARERGAIKNTSDAISVSTEGTGSRQRLIINLDNSVNYVGCQMDIKVPTGVRIVDQNLTGRANSHELAFNDIEDSRRILITALDNSVLLNTESALVVLDIEVTADYAGGDVEVENAIFADASARTFKLGVTTSGEATGITELGMGEKVVNKIYSVSGHVLDSLRKGVNIIVNSDGSTKKILKK